MKLSLGPILYYWSRDDVFAFYDEIADSPVDIVYLGETVCAKRHLLGRDDWTAIAEKLEAAGKEVVISTMTLIEAASELDALRRWCRESRWSIEANDMGAVGLLAAGKKTFVTGPAINIYNPRTMKKLADLGMQRWVLPVELSKESLILLQRQRPSGVETEVFAWGRLPLAYSARCFTARAHNLPKDDCQYRCLEYPDGLLLSTREETSFLCLNGIQTQSALTCNLIDEVETMRRLGVDVLRLSPQSRRTAEIIDCFYATIHGTESGDDCAKRLEQLLLGGACNGYWHGEAGMQKIPTNAAVKRNDQAP